MENGPHHCGQNFQRPPPVSPRYALLGAPNHPITAGLEAWAIPSAVWAKHAMYKTGIL